MENGSIQCHNAKIFSIDTLSKILWKALAEEQMLL